MCRGMAAVAIIENDKRLVCGEQGPESRRRCRACDVVAAISPQRPVFGIAFSDEGQALRPAKRKHAVACDAGLRIGVRLGRAYLGKGGPTADGKGADSLLRAQKVLYARRASTDGDRKDEQGEEYALEHGTLSEDCPQGIAKHVLALQARAPFLRRFQKSMENGSRFS